MKLFLKIGMLLFVALFVSSDLIAQDKSTRPSPAKSSEGMIGEASVAVNYSSPAVKGREIWGGLVPFDKIWRTGANEATTIEFSKDVMFQGEKVAAGKYAIFTIPGEKEWTVILNSDTGQWGAYNYSKEKDVVRVSATPQMVDESAERFDVLVVENGIVIQWEKLKVPVEIK